MSERNRDLAGEALITDRNGTVEGQRPEDLSWRDLQLRSILIEEEKVRTLSDSTAQITFRDASRLRLNANSNAIIRQMRFDPLSKREEAKVSLIEGDFYALLAGESDDRNRFSVEVAEVDAVIDSGDFWVSNGGGIAKFANYDDAVVEVAANGGEVILGKNEGTVVDKGEKPRSALAVLPPPTLAAPADEGPVYVTAPELSWAPVEGSAGYWLEISSDQNFERIAENAFGIAGPVHTAKPLAAGDYFWRVSALDGFGLPGERSETWRFRVTPDDVAPFLRIDRPARDAIFRKASIDVAGESEPGAEVTVNAGTIEVAEGGAFRATIEATPGENMLTITATDPAGNVTTDERRFVYMPDEDSVVAYDPAIPRIAPSHFLANGDVLSLAGTTTANSEIEIRSGETVRAAAVSDGAGVFRVNVPLAADDETFTFAVIAPSGFTTTEDFAVTIDREAPEIALDPLLPWLTAEETLRVAGTTDAQRKPHPQRRRDRRRRRPLRYERHARARREPDRTDRHRSGRQRQGREGGGQARPGPAVAGQRRQCTGDERRQGGAGDRSGGGRRLRPRQGRAVRGRRRRPNYEGYLRYNKAAKRYRGTVIVPEADLAGARLARVELEDDAGNRQVFEFQE